MENNKIFKIIYNQICTFLPDEWNKVIFYYEIGDDFHSSEFYVELTNHKFVKCYDLPNVDEDVMYERFEMLHEEITKTRKNVRSKDLWKSMTMGLKSDGNYFVDYDYDHLMNIEIDYKKVWKEKYLK